jgi:GNAT superfamily N-acetyltransferase
LSAIRDFFYTVYSSHYPYPQFYDIDWLKRSIFSDDILLLVAVDNETQAVLGSSSVVLDIGAHSDLVGEFGRLVVHPEPRKRGIGNALMAKRVELVRNRLHLGLVENRTSHVFSQKISLKHGFVPVGFLPLKIPFFQKRESMALFVQYFGDGLKMRNNHPRIIPEAHPLALFAFANCSLECDAIVDDQTPPYPHSTEFIVSELTTDELPSLLQIQRGRVSRRELFGPLRLHYGFFRLQMAHAQYLVVREPALGETKGRLVGAVGYIRNDHEKMLKNNTRPSCKILDRPASQAGPNLGHGIYRGRRQRSLAANAENPSGTWFSSSGLYSSYGILRCREDRCCTHGFGSWRTRH